MIQTMTSDFDLSSRFVDLAAPDPSPNLTEFGKLNALANWLITTGLRSRVSPSRTRELIVFSKSDADHESSRALPGIKISKHPFANQEASVAHSIELGIQIADRAIDSGVTLFFVASDQETRAHDVEILIGALTRADAASVAVRTNVGDQEWMDNVIHIRDEMFALRDLIADPSALLARTNSLDVAAMLGLILQSSNRATPVVLIGERAYCSALLAQRVSHRSRDWLIPALDLTSPAGALAQLRLDRPPILELAMPFAVDYLSQATLAAPIIDAMLELLSSNASTI
jgi:NaMN:DMB phosphoribosyltransferase